MLFLLYIWTRLDTLNLVLIVMWGLLSILMFFFMMGGVCETDEKVLQQFKYLLKRIVAAWAVLLILIVAIPTSKDLAILTGAYVLREVSQTTEAQEIASDLKTLILQRVKEAAKEEKK